MSNAVSIIFLVVSAGIFFGYINPNYFGTTMSMDASEQSVTELKASKANYEEALNKTREIEEVRNGLLTKYNNILEENRQKMDKLLPGYIDSVRLIIDVNSIASTYGMSVKGLKVVNSVSGTQTKSVSTQSQDSVTGPQMATTGDQSTDFGPSGKKYSSASLTFTVSGSYENFIQFVKSLEQSLRIVDINSIELKAGTGDTKSGADSVYDFLVSLDTYQLKQ
jgi:Tfp pilus assembly protein PilO